MQDAIEVFLKVWYRVTYKILFWFELNAINPKKIRGEEQNWNFRCDYPDHAAVSAQTSLRQREVNGAIVGRGTFLNAFEIKFYRDSNFKEMIDFDKNGSDTPEQTQYILEEQ